MKRLFIASLVAVLAGSGIACAAEDMATPAATVAPDAAAAPATPVLFLKPVLLLGTLGDLKVQVSIRPKAGIDEGVEGEYFIFGRSPKILLAGEIEGDAVSMEESEDGTNISGLWDGKLEGDTLSGNWTSDDGLTSKPFVLKVVSLKKEAIPSRTDKKVSATASKP